MDEEFKNQEHIDEMRKRLYERKPQSSSLERHQLSDKKIDVARDWGNAASPAAPAQPTASSVPKPEPTPEIQTQSTDDMTVPPVKKKHSFRVIVLLFSLLVFVVAAAVSSAYLYFGGNQISSNNIELSIVGPNAIGGGEDMSLQVGLTNQNAVALEAATLIMKYPTGTQTVEEPYETLFEERIWLDTLEPGEVKNIPVRAKIFGEEGDQKQIEATLEYRLVGSNGTFYKDAEPLSFQIVTSPVVVQVKSLRKVASGQQVEVDIEIKSNSSSPFRNLLVSASYPNGFSFTSAEPEPAFGQNVWTIPELLPEQTETFTIKGSIQGLTEEALRLNVSVGPARPDNQFMTGATLAESYTEFVIERPFLDVVVEVNDDTDGSVVLESSETALVRIDVENTLDESVYDMVIEVVPEGNAFRDGQVESNKGFYNSNTGVIRWESSNEKTLAQVLPGDDRRVEFSILPGMSQSTAAFDLTINVYGRRVAERDAQEQLVGTVPVNVRYSSNIGVAGSANVVTGPIPPTVGEETTYAVALVAEAGVNDVTNATVRTSLPVYVEWLDDYATEGSVTYNTVTRELEWRAGNIDGGKAKELVFTVNLLPSSSQVGITPRLVERQVFTANDRFTNASLRAESPFITTELLSNTGYEEDNGRVVEE